MKKKVVIIGGGFGGLSATKELARRPGFDVFLIDRKNHHLFQPLLYQVAMAGLNPSEIAIPFRRLLSGYKNIHILMAEVDDVDLDNKKIKFDDNWFDFDILILACGSKHFYFGHPEWEPFAPGLKTIEQATEIRRRILLAFELAEKEKDEKEKEQILTFVVVGAGPTGVELAGAIAELARHTLYKDYQNVDLKKTKVFLVEAGQRILSEFPEKLSEKAKIYLESLGVEVYLGQQASKISQNGLFVGDRYVKAQTIIWAAGVKPTQLSERIKSSKTKDGRIIVNKDLSIPGHPSIFVIGDQAAFPMKDKEGKETYLPGLAPVALQQGRFVSRLIKREQKKKERGEFKYIDKGIIATIGRSKAVAKAGPFLLTGFIAWLIWAVVHIAYLVRFKNKVFVLLQWLWAYFKFGRGARLIVHKNWRFYSGEKIPISRKNKQEKPELNLWRLLFSINSL